MDTLYRRWLILKMIPRHGDSITTAQIVERLEVDIDARSIRSIQRDLVEIERHFPITFDQVGRTFHWSWKEGWQLTLPVMDPHTALALHFAREYMSSLLPTTSVSYLEPFFRNAGDILAKSTNCTLASWPDKVRVVSRSLRIEPPSFRNGVTDMVYEAVLKGKRIKACYREQRNESAHEYSELNPLGLVFVDKMIYVIATDSDNVNPKKYLLNKMEEVILLEKTATVPEGFTLREYIERGEFCSETIRLKALLDREAAAFFHETPFPGKVILRDYDEDRVLLEGEISDKRQLCCWLLGFGAKVEVLAPEELREEFKSTVERFKKIYL